MKRIYKYPLNIENYQTVPIPKGSQILSVQEQRGALCVWALVDPSLDKEDKGFYIFGTGHDIPDNFTGKYIGTVISGWLVLHVFLE